MFCFVIKIKKIKKKEVTCFRLGNPRPQVNLHKKQQQPKLGPVPEGRPEEREREREREREGERAVLTSRWSALECPVLAPTLTNRPQLSHATNLPILMANRKVGVGGWGEGSSLLPSSLSTVWNYKHYCLGEVLSRAKGANRKC